LTEQEGSITERKAESGARPESSKKRRDNRMPKSKNGTSKYTDKQERKADHIAESYEEKGVSKKEAEARAWATVNKQDGGGKNPGGAGRKKR
jgi:hypothetical protein